MSRSFHSALAVPAVVCAFAAAVSGTPAASPIQKYLDSRVLDGTYNGVVVDYLLEEGKGTLTEAQRKQALDQLLAAMKAKARVTQGEQLTAALGNLVGVLMGAAGGDVAGEAGGEVQVSYANEWASWVDAAEKLLDAGYKEDAVSFFEFGMVNIPYDSLRGRCVMGLARAKPDEAYAILMNALKKPDIDLQNDVLRLLGHMAATDGLAKEQKDKIVETLIEYSKGITHSLNYGAAIYGLDVAGDPRAIPALSRFRKGFSVDELDRRAALRSLLLTYKEVSVVEDLTKKLKTGFTSTNKPADRFFSGVLLMEGGRKEGFDWALNELTPKKKGFFSSKEDDVDLRPSLVKALVRVGGEQARGVLAASVGLYKDDEWIKTWIAVGMLELGDTSGISLVKAALGKPDWDFTAVRISTALAKHGDFSGVEALKTLSVKKVDTSAPTQIINILGGKDTRPEKARLAELRRQIATALGQINQPSCVPVLIQLLGDEDVFVRSSAAFALTDMTVPAALDGLRAAIKVDYGVYNQNPRSPEIHAYVLRIGLRRFPREAGTKELLKLADASADPALRFMAMVARS
ncbi:MAG: HEAT repeat domain-containing protein [Acidobacteriota bacterium]